MRTSRPDRPPSDPAALPVLACCLHAPVDLHWGGRSFPVDSSVSAFRIRHWRAACCCCGCSSPVALPVHSLARTIARSVQSTLPSTMSSTIPKYAHHSNNSVPLRKIGLGTGIGIIIVKTLKSHSPRPPIAPPPLGGQTHTRPGSPELFMHSCAVRRAE